jgi:hypothetical protein
MLAWLIWAGTIVAGLFIYIGVAKKIEATGLKRLGATGNLFTCDPDRHTARKT